MHPLDIQDTLDAFDRTHHLVEVLHVKNFDGHFDTLWARYSPGRLVEDAVLRRVIADERYSVVDWMLGVAAEKILSATGARDAVSITATSQPTHIESSLVATSGAQA